MSSSSSSCSVTSSPPRQPPAFLPLRAAGPGQADADDAGRIAAHGPDLGLVETGDAPQLRGKHDVVPARRDLHPAQVVAFVDGDGPEARRAEALELLDGRLLDHAPT